MISSAVVIPEQEFEQLTPSPNLKRRQSSISSDTNKRPRLETQNSTDDGSQPTSVGAMSPPNRKRSAIGVGAAEEKKRGQRLFGALLGTLSQRSSKPAHKKRDEIEQRQRERVRKDTESREEERRLKREELDKVRREEQKIWEKESMKIRHSNIRATAGFLQTRSEPRLYYKPWELRAEEAEQIKRQIEKVEDEIQNELHIHPEDGDKVMREDSQDDPQDKTQPPSLDVEDIGDKSPEPRSTDDVRTGQGDQVTKPAKEDEISPIGDEILEQKADMDEKSKEDDHAGEELVEGQEDDVIY